jgi:hypothetical protein
LRAVAGVRESVDERFALVQEAIADKSDIEQIRETTSDELSHAVQERLKVTVQREIVNAIRGEVTRTVQLAACYFLPTTTRDYRGRGRATSKAAHSYAGADRRRDPVLPLEDQAVESYRRRRPPSGSVETSLAGRK